MHKNAYSKSRRDPLCPGLRAAAVLCLFCVLPENLCVYKHYTCVHKPEVTACSSHCLTHWFREKLGEPPQPVHRVATVLLTQRLSVLLRKKHWNVSGVTLPVVTLCCALHSDLGNRKAPLIWNGSLPSSSIHNPVLLFFSVQLVCTCIVVYSSSPD